MQGCQDPAHAHAGQPPPHRPAPSSRPACLKTCRTPAPSHDGALPFLENWILHVFYLHLSSEQGCPELQSMSMQAVHHNVMAGHAACRARPFTPAVRPPRRALAAIGVIHSAHRATLIDVRDLEACIASTKQAVLKGVNLSVKEGEVHAIMGKNGSGKSTFSKVGLHVRSCMCGWRACAWPG